MDIEMVIGSNGHFTELTVQINNSKTEKVLHFKTSNRLGIGNNVLIFFNKSGIDIYVVLIDIV